MLKNIKPVLTISRRMALGYFVILLIAGFASMVSVLTLESNKQKYNKITSVYLPNVSYLKEFSVFLKESQKLTNDWIYQANKDEKERLIVLHQHEYPLLQEKIKKISDASGDQGMKLELDGLLGECDEYIQFQERVMEKLATAQNYSNDATIDESILILEQEVKPRFKIISLHLDRVLQDNSTILDKVDAELKNSYRYLTGLMLVLLVLIFVVGSIASVIATRIITRPINRLRDVIIRLGNGEIPAVSITGRKDEIGEMTNAIFSMVESIKRKTEFASETGKGNYDTHFELLSDKDILGLALVDMRKNLKKVSEEDDKWNWVNTGIAGLNEILREKQEQEDQLYDGLISYIANYLHISQGGIYRMRNADQKESMFLELVAGYAHPGTGKAESRKFRPGEGLPGQAARDKKTIVILDVPPDYTKIVSGLGESIPKNIILVPFVFEDEVNGLIELSSVNDFTPLQIEFLEKIARKISVTFHLIGRKLKTEKLLAESRDLNAKLIAGKEELKNTNAELNTFIYKSSHDLKGPLTSIIGLTNLAKREIKDKQAARYLEMIGTVSGKLDMILKTLIQTMSIKEADLKFEEIDFNSILESTLQKFSEDEQFKRIKVRVKVENRTPFFSDSEILHAVFKNLIDNSVRYQNTTSLVSNLFIDIFDAADGVKINLTDNGMGIEKDLQQKVFDMFYRGNYESKGTGLGLYIVKNAVMKLGGQIELNSELGHGTSFVITLPNSAGN